MIASPRPPLQRWALFLAIALGFLVLPSSGWGESANGGALPPSIAAAGVTQTEWDSVRAEVSRQARRTSISETALIAAAEAAGSNLARAGHFDAPSLQQAIFNQLSRQADQIAELQHRLDTLTGDADPQIAQAYADARTALNEGRLADADRLLAQVEQRDLAVMQQADAEAERRRLRAGDTIAARGQVAFIQADYITAADFYARAAGTVPQSAIQQRYRYRIRQSGALSEQGARFGDAARLQEAVAVLRNDALPLVSRTSRAGDWAEVQAALGDALYQQGWRGDVGALHDGAAAFRAALQVDARARDPGAWAFAKTGLAMTLARLGEYGDGAAAREAVGLFGEAMQVDTRAAQPQKWANAQTNLGIALLVLGQHGDRDALAQSVAAFRSALEVNTREADPASWAVAQSHLSDVLREQGVATHDPAMFAAAAAALQGAMAVFTRDAAPAFWAQMQYGLGYVLVERGRILNDSAALHQALAPLRGSLEVFSPSTWPADYERSQFAIGVALYMRGQRGEPGLLPDAEAAFRNCLSVIQRDANPAHWADLQDRLGDVYFVESQQAGNDALSAIGRSVTAYEAALSATTRAVDAARWAQAQIKLGQALQYQGALLRSAPGAAAVLERSAAAYEAALTVRTKRADASAWAEAQAHLAAVFVTQAEIGVPGALERAVTAYEATLSAWTRDSNPRGWAQTENDLGKALRLLGERGAANALERAVAAHRAALSVYTREADAFTWAMSNFDLSLAYKDLGRAGDARSAAQNALSGFEQIGDAYWIAQAQNVIAQMQVR